MSQQLFDQTLHIRDEVNIVNTTLEYIIIFVAWILFLMSSFWSQIIDAQFFYMFDLEPSTGCLRHSNIIIIIGSYLLMSVDGSTTASSNTISDYLSIMVKYLFD